MYEKYVKLNSIWLEYISYQVQVVSGTVQYSILEKCLTSKKYHMGYIVYADREEPPHIHSLTHSHTHTHTHSLTHSPYCASRSVSILDRSSLSSGSDRQEFLETTEPLTALHSKHTHQPLTCHLRVSPGAKISTPWWGLPNMYVLYLCFISWPLTLKQVPCLLWFNAAFWLEVTPIPLQPKLKIFKNYYYFCDY